MIIYIVGVFFIFYVFMFEFIFFKLILMFSGFINGLVMIIFVVFVDL